MMNIRTIFILFFCTASLVASNIKVLFTAALINEDAKQRKKDYIRNLKLLKSYGLDVYVVESCRKGPSFLNKHCKNVCYTWSNDPSLSKSANEARSMRIGFSHFNFQPDDMIIKITGRYVLQTDEFVKLVQANMDADIIARTWNSWDTYTGVFAIKGETFLDFLDHNYLNIISSPEQKEWCIEHGLGTYMTHMEDQLKIVKWPRLYDYLPRCGPAGG